MEMPQPDAEVIARKPEIAARLREKLGADTVIDNAAGCAAYECDGLIAYRQPPLMVALPRSAEEVAAVLRVAAEFDAPVVPRGAGTSLCGGALPTADCILLGLARMNRILEISVEDRCVRVEAGVTNLSVTGAVAPYGFFYAPDPSSQLASLIGGNIAMNAGGAHCLKYGVTSGHVLGLRMVLADGGMVELGGPAGPGPGYDLVGLVCGSEGQLGVVTDAWLRILPAPPAPVRPCSALTPPRPRACVADIIRSGMVPAALEYMDRPAVEITEKFSGAGYPLDVEALLIVEVDGTEEEIADQFARIRAVAAPHKPVHGPREPIGRGGGADLDGAQGGLRSHGKVSDYLCMDGVIPTGACRTRCAGWPRSPTATDCGSRTSSTPATAICIR